jgi:hypothetical protein
MMEYRFSDILSGYFEFPTENARRLLPGHLEPVELHHGSSVLSVGVFDVVESPVGPYRSLALSVLVVPIIKGAGEEAMPNSAFYPFVSGTNRPEPRQLAIEHLHLPHWTDDLRIEVEREGRAARSRIFAAGDDPVLELTVTEYDWSAATHLYQCFAKDATGSYLAEIRAQGQFSDHQEETGTLRLYDHPFNAGLAIADVYEVPLRETWLKDGTQTFASIVPLQLV